MSTGKLKGVVKSLYSAVDFVFTKTSSKFLLKRGDDTNASVQVHIVRGISSKARKMHKLPNSQLSLTQAQLHLNGSDVRPLVCQ